MPSQAVTTLTGVFEEGTDYLYAPTEPLEYSDGTPVLSGHVSTFTITTADEATGTAIRSNLAVLGAGNGTLSAQGMLVVPITSADTAAIGSGAIQWRRLTFELLTNAGIHKNWVVRFPIRNFADV
jgi:hypothetical protein